MKVIVEGIMGSGLPWNMLAVGVVLAIVLTLFRVPVMPVAIGIYLPVGLSVAMLAGGLLRYAVNRRGGTEAATSNGEDGGTLFSAGLIAGEGLCGILLAALSLICR